MCGIIAYTGPRKAAGILVDGLKRLEYRGYDSAGIAVVEKQQIRVIRSSGKISTLEALISKNVPEGSTGIGHTRWATHGRPCDENAHPHSTGKVAIVHNGIIENYMILKKKCIENGRIFLSETDTEVLAHLIDMNLNHCSDLLEASRKALLEVEGSYAIAVISTITPDRIVIAKNASPLVIGIGDGEMFAASDIPAILPYTKQMTFLDEKEIAIISPASYHIETLDGKTVEKKPKIINWSLIQAEKGGYKHFMLKEIFEQPKAIEDTIRGRISMSGDPVNFESMGLNKDIIKETQRVFFVACGTSYHAAVYGSYLIEKLASTSSCSEIASEFRGRNPVVKKGDLLVAISQSGETIDTLQAVKIAKDKGAKILSIVNVIDSAIARASDMVLYTHAGPEIGVASTKCFTSQLAALVLLAAAFSYVKEAPEVKLNHIWKIIRGLVKIPGFMRSMLNNTEHLEKIARKFMHTQNFLYLGRGLNYPVAMEGALKLKEISYIHAEAYAAGEMKHGPIALIDRSMPVVVIMPPDEQYDRIKGNLEEVKAREGIIIAVTTCEGAKEVKHLCNEIIDINETEPELYPLLTILPLQLLAYYIADMRGTDVDQPRNLAKTVTVE